MLMRVVGGSLVLAAGLLLVAGCGGGTTKAGKSLPQQYQDALKMADPGLKAKALATLAEKQQKVGDLLGTTQTLAAAKETAYLIKDPASRANVLVVVAGTFAKLNESPDDVKKMLKDAGKAIEEIPDADPKVSALVSLASSTGQYLKNPDAAAVHLKTAEETVAEVELPQVKLAKLALIAAGYSKLELDAEAQRVLTSATELARAQPEPRDQAEGLNEIAGVLFTTGKASDAQAMIAEAQKAAEQIQADESRAYALLHIAQKLIAAKQFEEGKKLVSQAQDFANKVTDSGARQQLLDDIDVTAKKL